VIKIPLKYVELVGCLRLAVVRVVSGRRRARDGDDEFGVTLCNAEQ
jgi:hypothetical protein